jgi:5-methylcytosine-specific restriction endonuclease McrA
MPIRPENKERYPDNWKDIRARILARAEDKCEECGAANKERHPVTNSIVCLTIAHLDHTPENNEAHNLRAWCQRCHNRYDAPTRARGIKERKHEKSGQGKLL